MFEHLLQLTILFFVIIDPFASFTVFFAASKGMNKKEKSRMALSSVVLAAILSFAFVVFGNGVLNLFSTTINEFKVAGGIILGILGLKMALGLDLVSDMKQDASRAIASIIATPLLTGPASITAIIISVNEYGMAVTAIAVAVVLAITAIFFFLADRLHKLIGTTAIQVISTILGLVTLSWGVKFVVEGLVSIL